MAPEDESTDVWRETQDALMKIIPFYAKGNRVISLGRDAGYRREGIVAAVKTGDVVMDLGCGPGTMSAILLDSVGDVGNLVLTDPLMPMLKAAKIRVPRSPSRFVNGLFESLPFRNEIFDVVMCGFSLRDAQNYRAAVEEIGRVLKRDGGRLLIVDLGKPDNRLLRWLIGLYFRFIAGFLAFLFLGRKGLLFSRIYPTYRKYPRVSQIHEILQERFTDVAIDTKMLGGAMIAIAKNPKPVQGLSGGHN